MNDALISSQKWEEIASHLQIVFHTNRDDKCYLWIYCSRYNKANLLLQRYLYIYQHTRAKGTRMRRVYAACSDTGSECCTVHTFVYARNV